MNLDRTLLIHRMDGLRLTEKQLLSELFDSAESLSRLDKRDIESLIGRRLGTEIWSPADYRRQAETDLDWLAAGQGNLLAWGEPEYPAWLAEIGEPPFALYCRGRTPPPGESLLAVVGTRQPSEAGRLAAWEVGRDCAAAGLGLVSGLAFGIDAAAHAGCVHSGGYSVGVLAGGIDLVQPRSNRPLAARLLETGGTVLSEFGPGTVARKWHFPVRNRIISGLCAAVVVVEAPERSGALITAQYGLEQGRDVYVHAAGCAGHRGTGTRKLAESGAVRISGLAELVRPGG